MKQIRQNPGWIRLAAGVISAACFLSLAAGCKPSNDSSKISSEKSNTATSVGSSSAASSTAEESTGTAASGSGSVQNPSKNTSRSSAAPIREIKGDADKIPKRDLGGYTFTYVSMWEPPVQIAPVKGKDALNDAYYQRNEKLMKEWKFKIKAETKPSTEMNSYVMQNVLSGANPGDILRAEYSKLRGWMMADISEPISTGMPNLDLKNTSKWDPTLSKFLMRNGKTYAVGGSDLIPDGEVLFFNASLLKERNLTSPYDLYNQNKWTWQAFKDLLVKTTIDTNGDKTPDIYGLGYTNWATLHFETPFSMTNGKNVVTYDAKGKGIFNGTAPNVLESLEFVQGLKDQKVVYPNLPGDNSATAKAFGERKFAFMIHQFVVVSNKNMTNMKDDFGVVPLPKGPKASDHIFMCTQFPGYSTTPACPDPDKASTIFNLLMEPLPATGNPKIDDPDYDLKYNLLRDDDSFRIFSALKQKSVPNDLYYSGILSNWRDAIVSIQNGRATPKSAMESIKDAVDKALEDAYQRSIAG